MVECSKHGRKFNPDCADCRSLEKAIKGSTFAQNEYVTDDTRNNDT